MTKLQSYGVKAGLLIGLAFLIVRLSMAKTLADLMLACGATMIEVALVLFLEHKAKELEPKIVDWLAKEAARRNAEGALEAGSTEAAFRDHLVTENQQARLHIEREREMNAALSNEKKLVAIAVSASNGGYVDGLVERRVRLHDRPRNNNSTDRQQDEKEEAA